MWWCEGSKTTISVKITSSDQILVSNFLSLFRFAFDLNESKFRCLLHLHDYHNEEVQKNFWSDLTKIPLNQFYRSYHKPNTGKRTRENYPGCIAVAYYDAKIAKELLAIYNAFTKLRGVR